MSDTETVARKPKSEQRQRTAMICIRLLPDELYAVQAHAAEAGYTSVSGWLRDLALADGIERCPCGEPGDATTCPGSWHGCDFHNEGDEGE